MNDSAVFSSYRLHARQKGPEDAVSTAQRKNHFESVAGSKSILPSLQHGWQHFGIMHRLPSPALHLFERFAGVFVPAAVIPENVALRIGYPNQVGNIVSQSSQAFFAITQRSFRFQTLGLDFLSFVSGGPHQSDRNDDEQHRKERQRKLVAVPSKALAS